jgi:hypothetical protein
MKQIMHWLKFNKTKGSRQRRPPIKKWVVVKLKRKADGYPCGLSIGYRKDAAGDKQCPYFIIPGIGGEVIAWCDCLPDNFDYPKNVGEEKQ